MRCNWFSFCQTNLDTTTTDITKSAETSRSTAVLTLNYTTIKLLELVSCIWYRLMIRFNDILCAFFLNFRYTVSADWPRLQSESGQTGVLTAVVIGCFVLLHISPSSCDHSWRRSLTSRFHCRLPVVTTKFYWHSRVANVRQRLSFLP